MQNVTMMFDGPGLKAAREAMIDESTGRPWSQSVLAYRLRDEGAPVSPQTVAKWEKGFNDARRAEPQGRFLIALAKVFGRQVETFFRPVKTVAHIRAK